MAQFRIEYKQSMDRWHTDIVTCDSYEVADDCVTFYNESDDELDGFVALYSVESIIKIERID
jgi:hypothetical protein